MTLKLCPAEHADFVEAMFRKLLFRLYIRIALYLKPQDFPCNSHNRMMSRTTPSPVQSHLPVSDPWQTRAARIHAIKFPGSRISGIRLLSGEDLSPETYEYAWVEPQQLFQISVLFVLFLTRRNLFGPDGISLRGALEAGGP